MNLADRDGVSPLAAAFAYHSSRCPFHVSVHYDIFEKRPFFSRVISRVRANLREADPSEGGCSELRACVGFLLQSGADASLADVSGNAPLCRLFTASCFRTFLGARDELSLWITPPDRHRITPLLVQHGADPESRITPSKEWIEANKRVRRPKRAARHWPLTPMQNAFWDSDFAACQCLLEAGVVPNKEVVLWMFRLVLEETGMRDGQNTARALEFIKRLPTELRCASLRNPLCLILALQQGRLDLARDIWNLGPELSQFSEKRRTDSLTRCIPSFEDEKYIELGVACLDAAVREGAVSILEGMLELGVRPIPGSALLHAVSHSGDPRILKALVEHGGKIHIEDNETDGNGASQQRAHWHEFAKCTNPMKLAIRQRNHPAIKTMLSCSPDPVDPWFRYFYLKEAYTLLDPTTLACLLEHTTMRFDEADITDKADLPLAHLVRNAERICSLPRRPVPEFGPQSRMDAVKTWIDCIAAFAQAGVDPTMRDRAGKSALDYLEEHMAYVGKARFRNHLASALRSDGGLDPEHKLGRAGSFYEALESIGIQSDTVDNE